MEGSIQEKGRHRQKKLGRVAQLQEEASLWPAPVLKNSSGGDGDGKRGGEGDKGDVGVDGDTVLELAEEQQMLEGQEKVAELEEFRGSNSSVLGGNALAKHAIFIILGIAFGVLIVAPVVAIVHFTYDPYLVDFYVPELPNPPIPVQREKWSYGVPFPTNRDLLWITADFWGESFLMGGAEGTLIYSTFDSLTSSASIPRNATATATVDRRMKRRSRVRAEKEMDSSDDDENDALTLLQMQERYPGYCSRLVTSDATAAATVDDMDGSGAGSAWEGVNWSVVPSPPSSGTAEAGAVIGEALLVQLRETDGSLSYYALEEEDSDGEEVPVEDLHWHMADFAFDGGVAFGNGVWLGISHTRNCLYRSEDGHTWTVQKITVSKSGNVEAVIANLKAIAFGNGRFVVLAIKQTQQVAYVSTGTGVLPWLYAELDSTFSSSTEAALITFGAKASQFVAFYDQHIETSPDGLEWEEVTTVESLLWSLSCGYRRCVGVGSDYLVVESDNGGVTWSVSRSLHGLNAAACNSDDICVAVGPRGTVFFSVVFSGWRSVGAVLAGGVETLSVSNKGSMDSLFFGQWKASPTQEGETEYAQIVDDAFYPVLATENIVNENGMVISCNGIDWLLTTNPVAASLTMLVEGNDIWVAITANSLFYYSYDPSDPTSWETKDAEDPNGAVLLDLIFDGYRFIVIGFITHQQFLSSDVESDQHGLVFSSTDGIHWDSADSNVVISELRWDKANQRYIGLEYDEGLHTSKDAKNWAIMQEGRFTSLAVNNRTGVALATGENALYVSSDGGLNWKETSSCKCSPCATLGTLSFIPEVGGFFHTGTDGLLSVTYDDGSTWKTVVLPFTLALENVAYGSGMLVLRAADETVNSIAGSFHQESSGALLTVPVQELQFAACALAA